MHYFEYKNNQLFCERIPLKELALKFKTPLYVYSKKTLVEHYQKLKRAFKELNPLICYSVKANSNLSILKILKNLGAGFDIVSGGELYRLKTIKAPPNKIVFAGVGKTEEEIRSALDYKILLFNVESLSELEKIDKICRKKNTIAKVCLRYNPDIKVSTHKFIRTGESETKFGMDKKTILQILKQRERYENIKIEGIHIHIGSQISEPQNFVSAIKKAKELIKKINMPLKYFNIGGGFAAQYDFNEPPTLAQDFARYIKPLLKDMKLKIILEPGRFIVANAGVLITKVLYIKKSFKKRFCIVDAGFTELIRPALYSAYHFISPLELISTKDEYQEYDVVGPICETTDFLAKSIKLPASLKEGDFLCVFSCGAYGMSMSSNYNSRRRSAEVLVDKDRFYLIRKRETYKDLIRKEMIV